MCINIIFITVTILVLAIMADTFAQMPKKKYIISGIIVVFVTLTFIFTYYIVRSTVLALPMKHFMFSYGSLCCMPILLIISLLGIFTIIGYLLSLFLKIYLKFRE